MLTRGPWQRDCSQVWERKRPPVCCFCMFGLFSEFTGGRRDLRCPPPTPGPREKRRDSPLRTVLAPSPASRAVGLGGGRDRQVRAARPLCTATLSAPRTPSEALFLVLTRRARKRTARRGASSRGHRRACPPTLPPQGDPHAPGGSEERPRPTHGHTLCCSPRATTRRAGAWRRRPSASPLRVAPPEPAGDGLTDVATPPRRKERPGGGPG